MWEGWGFTEKSLLGWDCRFVTRVESAGLSQEPVDLNFNPTSSTSLPMEIALGGGLFLSEPE